MNNLFAGSQAFMLGPYISRPPKTRSHSKPHFWPNSADRSMPRKPPGFFSKRSMSPCREHTATANSVCQMQHDPGRGPGGGEHAAAHTHLEPGVCAQELKVWVCPHLLEVHVACLHAACRAVQQGTAGQRCLLRSLAAAAAATQLHTWRAVAIAALLAAQHTAAAAAPRPLTPPAAHLLVPPARCVHPAFASGSRRCCTAVPSSHHH